MMHAFDNRTSSWMTRSLSRSLRLEKNVKWNCTMCEVNSDFLTERSFILKSFLKRPFFLKINISACLTCIQGKEVLKKKVHTTVHIPNKTNFTRSQNIRNKIDHSFIPKSTVFTIRWKEKVCSFLSQKSRRSSNWEFRKCLFSISQSVFWKASLTTFCDRKKERRKKRDPLHIIYVCLYVYISSFL